MSLTILLNGLLGAICSLRFKIQIFIALTAIAFVEVVLFRENVMRSSVVWSAVVLIWSLEIGYLVGASLGTWQSSIRERAFRDFMRHGASSRIIGTPTVRSKFLAAIAAKRCRLFNKLAPRTLRTRLTES